MSDALDALDALAMAKSKYGQGAMTLDELVATAEAYRAAIIARKESEPARFRRLPVPSIAQLLR